MKNKEIEELLNELKDEDNYIEEYGYSYKRIALNDCWLLLSYIEQIEDKINWYENIDINKTIDKFRVEHNKEIKKLHNKIEQLENNRDKAIEFIENHFLYHYGSDKAPIVFEDNYIQKIVDILKGDSDYE